MYSSEPFFKPLPPLAARPSRCLTLFLPLALAVWSGCGNGAAPLREDIARWELLAATDTEAADSLAVLYGNYLKEYPDDPFGPSYTLQAARLDVQRQKSFAALDILEAGIKRYGQAPELGEMLLLAGQLAEEALGDSARAAAHFNAYRSRFPQGPDIELAELFFKGKDEKMRYKMGRLDAALDDANQPNGINEQAAEQYLAVCTDYLKQENKPSDGGVFCDKAGKLASAMGESLMAVEYWTYLSEHFPDYPLLPEALFRLANEYETALPRYLKRARRNRKSSGLFPPERTAEFGKQPEPLQSARELYERITRDYAGQEIARVASTALSLSGKDPNAVVNQFIKQNKKEQ